MPRSRTCVAVLATGLLLLSVGPAAAAGGITAPGVGEVVAVQAVVPLRAVVEGPVTEPSELRLQAPGAQEAEVVAVSTDPDGGELAHDFDTSCPTGVCTSPVPAANGTWTLQLAGAAEDERTFVLRIPPAAPAEVSAARSEAGVLVRWQQGAEPDLRGYRIEDGDGRVVRDRIGLDACDAERFCSAEVPEAGGSWSVVAFRATCPDCPERLASPPSAAAGADGVLPTRAPVAVPSAAPSQAARPAERPDQRRAFLDSFGGRPLAQAAPQPGRSVAPAAPQADGSFDQELGYGEREVVVPGRRAPLSRAQEALGSALGTGERLRLLGLSALMVGAALWLRRWSRRVTPD